jgi:hypothetical protein
LVIATPDVLLTIEFNLTLKDMDSAAAVSRAVRKHAKIQAVQFAELPSHITRNPSEFLGHSLRMRALTRTKRVNQKTKCYSCGRT